MEMNAGEDVEYICTNTHHTNPVDPDSLVMVDSASRPSNHARFLIFSISRFAAALTLLSARPDGSLMLNNLGMASRTTTDKVIIALNATDKSLAIVACIRNSSILLLALYF